MEKFTRLTATAAALPASNIDTDVIMPKQFLKRIDRQGLAIGFLHDLRFKSDGSPDRDFILNRPGMEETKVLVTGPNFGCGSSREHAVWGILQYGIRAIIGTTFGSIFADNAANNGLPLISLDENAIEKLQTRIAAGDHDVTVDLKQQLVSTATFELPFAIDPAAREALMLGLDRIGQTLKRAEQLRAFEKAYLSECPWLSAGEDR